MGGALAALLAVALLVALVVFRLIEVTFIRLGRARAAGLDEASDELQLADLISDREVLLAPVTILRVISQVGLIALAVNVGRTLGGTVLSVAVAAFLLFVIGEAIPRRWAIEANDEMAKWLSRPARMIARFVPLQVIAQPLVVLVRRFGPRTRQEVVDPVVEDELVALAEAAAEASLIEDDEAHLIGSIIELGDTIVREVMVPRPDMVTLQSHSTVSEALAVVVDTGFTRLPVVGETVDDVIGLVLSKDLVAAQLEDPTDTNMRSLVREAVFVPESKRVVELMREMQASKSHLAIVVDEYGGTAGLVSLEDILEELIGEIVDEFDREEALVQEQPDGSLLLSGRLPVDDFEELIGITTGDGEWDTVGGFVFGLLGHVPKVGESVEYQGWELTAKEIDNRRINLIAARPGTTG
ncbi:MAG: hemolysin family protein [Acidimicrobiales bacterium]|nr:hemolysin family protein [Acidimicrobiales bacterium]